MNPPNNVHCRWEGASLRVAYDAETDPAVGGYAIDLSSDGGKTWQAAPIPWTVGRATTVNLIPGLDRSKVWEVSVRAIGGSARSAPVTVQPVAVPPPPPPPPPHEEPPHVPPPPLEGLRVGIDAGNSSADVTALKTLGAKVVRLEVGASSLGNVASLIAPYKAAGIKVNLLVGFYASMISSAQCQQVGQVAHEHADDLESIEVGNETGYGYQYHDGVQNASYHERATTYAHRFVECAQAAAGSGVPLLCQADDGGSGSSVWVDSMFAAFPKLNEYVGAYVVHSYGPGGVAKMERAVRFLGNHGVKDPHMASTEDGIATDNGANLTDNYGYARNLDYDAAGHEWAAHLTHLLAIPNMTLVLLIYYQGRDQRPHGADAEREHYFGALQQNGQPKGGLTTEIERVCHASV